MSKKDLIGSSIATLPLLVIVFIDLAPKYKPEVIGWYIYAYIVFILSTAYFFRGVGSIYKYLLFAFVAVLLMPIKWIITVLLTLFFLEHSYLLIIPFTISAIIYSGICVFFSKIIIDALHRLKKKKYFKN